MRLLRKISVMSLVFALALCVANTSCKDKDEETDNTKKSENKGDDKDSQGQGNNNDSYEQGDNPLTPPESQHEMVDLGLPSGLKWATCNFGANSFDEYGSIFEWGSTIADGEGEYYIDDRLTSLDDYPIDSTIAKEMIENIHLVTEDFSLDTSLVRESYAVQVGGGGEDYCSSSRLDLDFFSGFPPTLRIGTLMPKYDAASKNWGNGWRTPTAEDYKELFRYCKVTVNRENRRFFYPKSFKLTGPNGNSIILLHTKAGCRYWTSTYAFCQRRYGKTIIAIDGKFKEGGYMNGKYMNDKLEYKGTIHTMPSICDSRYAIRPVHD